MARLQGHARNDGTVDLAAQGSGTRERILDISLELFTTQGYDKTSLREIAEHLGFSKAAIYYHFESKEAILMALHMRLHAIGLDALRNIDRDTMTLDVWSTLIDQMIDQMLSHRALFILHERNRTAMEGLHDENARGRTRRHRITLSRGARQRGHSAEGPSSRLVCLRRRDRGTRDDGRSVRRRTRRRTGRDVARRRPRDLDTDVC